MELTSSMLPNDLPWPEISVILISLTIVSSFCYKLSRDDDEAPVEYTVSIPDQCKPGWEGKILDEPSVKTPGSSAIQCYNPANGQLLGQVNPTTPDGINRAIAKATEAQKQWGKTTFKQRRKVLRTMLKYILDNQETIATVACLDSGKTKTDAMLGEILVTVEKLQWTLKHGEKALRPEKRPTNLLMMYKHNEVRWEPLGVLAACVSWNYPFHNLLSPITSTLFTGSALVIKSSEQTAFSLSYFASIARSALVACSHSKDLIQPLVCWPNVAQHLTSHPGIAHLLFIGSRPVAHAVAASAAKSLTPLCMELGGKDPAIVLDSVTSKEIQETVVPILLKGIFTSAGQNCIGIERIIATPKAYSILLPYLTQRISALKIGSPLHDKNIDIGATISSSSFPTLQTLISSAISSGATLHTGGKPYTHPHFPKGHYFPPTLLSSITPEMKIAQTELFAPIALLFPATSLSHAIEIANSTPYSLGCSIFSTNNTETERCINGIKAGMVSVNDFGSYYATGLPFGGVGGSGYGRFGGEEGLRSICNLKSVCKDAGWARWMGVGTKIPQVLDFGHADQGKKMGFLKGLMALGYAEAWAAKINGLWEMWRNA